MLHVPVARAARRGVVVALASALLGMLAPASGFAASGESAARSVQAGAIAAGTYTTCALRGGGRVGCWGAGDHGQLGNNAQFGDNAGAQVVSDLDDATQVAFGAIHGCALRINHTVWCWGSNSRGQIGDGSTPAPDSAQTTPKQVPGLTDATAITAMNSGTCALRAGGTVACWGDNDGGEIGQPIDASNMPDSAFVTTPHTVAGINNVIAIDGGWFHTCAVKADHTLWCWGFNGDGQVGQTIQVANTSDERVNRFATPTQFPDVTDAVAVSAGAYETCILRQSGEVACAGSNWMGEAGVGTYDAPSSTLRTVQGLNSSPVVQIAAGRQTTCALHASGLVECWGSDDNGQLGNDAALASQPLPQPVHDLVASAISIDGQTTCAITRAGGASCWGDDTFSQVGNGGDFGGRSTGPAGVLEFSTPYGTVASPAPSITAPASLSQGAQGTARVSVRNNGPDAASFTVAISTDSRATLGAGADAAVDVAGDHAATWRTGSVPAGDTVSVDLPLVGASAGTATVRATVVGSSALDPRRPTGAGAFADGQRASANTTVTSGATPPSASGGPTPPAPLDVKKLINLANAKCHKPGAPVRIVLTAPAGTRVQLATAKLSKGAAAPITGSVNGTLRLPKSVSKAIDASPKKTVKVTINVVLADSRVASRTLTVTSC